MSSGSGISLTRGGDNAKALWLPFRAEGEEFKLLFANERLGVARLSSSSIVLYLYASESLEGKLLVLRRSRSLVLRPEEKVGGLSSKMVSIGGPRLPELLLVVVVVLVGNESKASLWQSVLASSRDLFSLSEPSPA
jgi:hypothetical protein